MLGALTFGEALVMQYTVSSRFRASQAAQRHTDVTCAGLSACMTTRCVRTASGWMPHPPHCTLWTRESLTGPHGCRIISPASMPRLRMPVDARSRLEMSPSSGAALRPGISTCASPSCSQMLFAFLHQHQMSFAIL